MKVGDRVVICRNNHIRTGLSNWWIGLAGELIDISDEGDLPCKVRIEENNYHYDVYLPLSYLKREKNNAY